MDTKHQRKGKTYEEIYGLQKAKEIKEKLRESHLGQRGFWIDKKRYYFHPEERKRKISQTIKRLMAETDLKQRISKTMKSKGYKGMALEERYGYATAEKMKQILRLARLGKKPWNRDKGLSEEHKSKLRLAKTRLKMNRERYEEWRRKISQSKKGQRASPATEWKKGQIPWNKGKFNIYSQETLKKMSEARKGKNIGEKHPMWDKHHKKESIEKIRLAFLGKSYEERFGKEKAEQIKQKLRGKMPPNKGKPLSERIKKILREKSKKQWASEEARKQMSEIKKKSFIEHPEWRKKISEIQTKFYREHPEYREQARERRLKQIFPKERTSPEIKLRDELIRRGILFKEQEVIHNICRADFFIPPKIVVFVDGDYWHTNPMWMMKRRKNELSKAQRKNIEVDKRHNKLLEKNGKIVLRFWESDIKVDVKKCIDKVEKILN